ncbi:hypothetical protein [Roseococcus thiosulfatophilus]|uniref:hypothetical protein n=1 Tax=Roseococcus thiosulfatophilus TaxID=35813 RepID=UPI001A8F539B|nr:hypothetical protein [Roseococcus thiosulfatophilus]
MAEALLIGTIISSVASAGLGIMQSNQQAGAMRIQADQQRLQGELQMLQARQEENRGAAEALDVRRNLLRTLGAQNARYAAAGLVQDEGTPAVVAEDTQQDALREGRTVETNAALRASSARLGAADSRIRATLLQGQASATQTAGYIGAGVTLLQGGIGAYNRFPGSTGGAGGAGLAIPSMNSSSSR